MYVAAVGACIAWRSRVLRLLLLRGMYLLCCFAFRARLPTERAYVGVCVPSMNDRSHLPAVSSQWR